jgi:hypothetical protein
MRKGILCVALGLAAILAAGPAQAQTPSQGGDGWKHTIALYAVGSGLSGKASIGQLDVDVDLSFSDILDHLEMGGMLAYRGEKGKMAVMANAAFMGLGATKDLPGGGTGELDADQTFVEGDFAWRVTKHWETYFGLRGYDLDNAIEIRPSGLPIQAADDRESWVDPLVGMRFSAPLGKKWEMAVRGDIGGWGIGSDLAWQVLAHFDWKLTDHFGLDFGYIILDIDYEHGTGPDFFAYDVTMSGPLAAASFTF